MRIFSYILLMLITVSTHAVSKQIIKYSGFNGEDIEKTYFISLLNLALQKTIKTHGPYQLKKIEMPMFQGRAVQQLQQKNIDVLWTMTSKKRERDIEPIRIPTINCLGGLRVFLIRKNDQNKFATIESLEQLKQLYAGQGHDWPDTEILIYHGFNLVKGTQFEAMENMLSKKRFDYFPRGLHEISKPLRHENLIIESQLALHYIAPIFYFVHKNNIQLKQRIEVGLRALIDNGELLRFYNQHAITHKIKQRAGLAQRRIFMVENPILSKLSQKSAAKYCH